MRGLAAPHPCLVKEGRIVTTSPTSSWRPLALLLSFGLIMGCMMPLAKMAAAQGVPPAAYAFWQALGGGGLILALCRLQGRLPPLAPRHLCYYAVSGLTAIAFPNALMFAIVPRLGAGLASVVYAFPALMTFALAVAFGMERPQLRRAAGIGLGLAGTLLILLPRGSLPDPSQGGWMLLALLAPMSLAIGNIYRSRYWPPGTPPQALAAGMLLGAALLLVPVMPVMGGFYLPFTGAAAATAIIMTQILVTAVGYLLFFELQRIAGPVYLSQVGYVMTTAGLIFAMVIFGESYSLWVWGAVALVFLGVAVTNSRPPLPKSAKAAKTA